MLMIIKPPPTHITPFSSRGARLAQFLSQSMRVSWALEIQYSSAVLISSGRWSGSLILNISLYMIQSHQAITRTSLCQLENLLQSITCSVLVTTEMDFDLFCSVVSAGTGAGGGSGHPDIGPFTKAGPCIHLSPSWWTLKPRLRSTAGFIWVGMNFHLDVWM